MTKRYHGPTQRQKSEWAQDIIRLRCRNAFLPILNWRPPPLLNTPTNASHNWLSSTTKQVEYHNFLDCSHAAARKSHCLEKSDISTSSILDSMASYPSTFAHSFKIRVPVVPTSDHPQYRSSVSQVTSFIAIATSLSPKIQLAEARTLTKLGILLQLC